MTELDASVESGEPKLTRSDTDRLMARALDMLPRSAAALLDLDGRFLAVHGEALASGDFPRERLIGRRYTEVFAERTVRRFVPLIERALKGDSGTLEVLAIDDRSWFLVDAKPVIEGGRVVAVLGFATDISSRKQVEDQLAEEKEFFEDVLDSVGHLVLVKDDERKVLHLNRFFEQYVGISRSDAIGRPIDEFFSPEIAKRLRRDDNEVFERGEAVRVERQLPAADGSIGTLLTERSPLRRADGSIYGIVTVGLDISDRLAAERELAEARTLFETAFTNAPNGMALIALNGSFLRVNPAMSLLTGYPEDELTQLRVVDITHPDDMAEQVDLIGRALEGEFESYSLEKRFTRKSGETVWLVLAVSLVRSEDGEPSYVVAQTTNISDSKQVEVDLRTEVGRDPLTGLANRRQLETALGELLEKCRSDRACASLLLLDFDDFKGINDSHGHMVGDGMLQFVAGELGNRIRSTDLAARLGGDEFVLVLNDLGPEQSDAKAIDLMEHFDRAVYDPDGLNLRCPVSVGSATITAATPSVEAALVEADRAMYEAKRSRRPV